MERYNQRRQVHRLVSIYDVLPWQIVQQLEQRSIQGDQKIFYIQQPNQSQTNNAIEGGEEGEAIHVHEDYRNHPYQPPALTSDQQQQIKEDLALMTRKWAYPYEYMDSFERF